MRTLTPNRWVSTLVMAGVFALTLAFNNCSDMDFQQSNDASAKVSGDGNQDEQAVEVIDTTGMDGEDLSEENLEDLEEEIENRRQNRETEVVYTEADECDPNKVVVCHVPSGNPAERHEICVSVNALKAHVGRHGDGEHLDKIGSCMDVFKIDHVEDPDHSEDDE